MQTQFEENERVLNEVQFAGGGYVWDSDAGIFAVTLMDVVPNDELAKSLCALVGVQQIAINSCRLTFDTVRDLARIPNLDSLVLNHAVLTDDEAALLKSLVPELILVNE
jgi:hypothetical protein